MLLAVSKAAGKDCEGLSHIAAGLQGGMMAGEVCGAVSGAVLAIGLLYGEEQVEATTQMTGQFMRRFTELNGAVRCIDIIGFNIGSANTGLEVSSLKNFLLFLAGGGRKRCNKVVKNAVQAVLEEIMDREAQNDL